MPKLVFVRHGLSEWNKLDLFTGWTDVDLAPEGVQEAIEGGQARTHPQGQQQDRKSVV